MAYPCLLTYLYQVCVSSPTFEDTVFICVSMRISGLAWIPPVFLAVLHPCITLLVIWLSLASVSHSMSCGVHLTIFCVSPRNVSPFIISGCYLSIEQDHSLVDHVSCSPLYSILSRPTVSYIAKAPPCLTSTSSSWPEEITDTWKSAAVPEGGPMGDI